MQTPKIYCKKCLNFYHADCEDLTADEVREISKTKYDYTCTLCKIS